MITTTGFSAQARFTGKAWGVEGLQIAEYPGPLGIHDANQIAQNVESSLFDRIVKGLTDNSGIAGAESKAGRLSQRDVVFTGTVEEVNRFFVSKEWTDGLPIVPPTIKRVEEFLRYTDRSPDEVIAVLPSANLGATPWNIAVNAVMAGCNPEHMPLILAAVEALGDERCCLGSLGSTSGIFPYILINGPIVKQLGIEHGAQLISRGPNPAIGRAIALIVRNIAGFRPGTSYMGTFGYPLAFTLAESDDQTPWEQFHVEQGFDRNVSTVTIGVTNNWGASPAAYDTPDQSGAETALQLLAREITHKTRLFNFPGSGPDAETVMITLLISPSVAKSLAAAGYTKQDVIRLVYEKSRMPLREFDWVLKYTAIMRTTARERAEAGVFPKEFMGEPDDIVRILSSPDVLTVVVCGDPHRNRVMVLEGGHTRPTTKPITLPKNWDELLRSSK
ncbi:MAG: hypothetical protein KF771_09805 [Burkholderiales bacterium]|nr:hypothetical protein [Burkholderiales bacterium]